MHLTRLLTSLVMKFKADFLPRTSHLKESSVNYSKKILVFIRGEKNSASVYQELGSQEIPKLSIFKQTNE